MHNTVFHIFSSKMVINFTGKETTKKQLVNE